MVFTCEPTIINFTVLYAVKGLIMSERYSLDSVFFTCEPTIINFTVFFTCDVQLYNSLKILPTYSTKKTLFPTQIFIFTNMPSWPSATDSEEETYQQIRLQDMEDELQFLNELTLQDQTHNRRSNFQHPPEAPAPHVQPVYPQSVPQPRQEVEVYRVPTPEQEVDSYPVWCYCGYAVQVVVRAEGNDIGRRMQICPSYPNGCNYTEWIDDPLCPRGIAYSNELEQRLRRVENEKEQLRLSIMRLP